MAKKSNKNKNKNNNKREEKKHHTADNPSLVVGPNYVQVLQGNLLNKQVALVLCGESHEDAIDVTRSGGIFESKEGWTTTQNNIGSMSQIMLLIQSCAAYYRALGVTKKTMDVEKAKEWGKKRIIQEDAEVYDSGPIVLLWVPEQHEQQQQSKVSKGNGHLLEFCRDVDDIIDSDDDEDNSDWIAVHDSNLPISDWLRLLSSNNNNNDDDDTAAHRTTTCSEYRSFVWADDLDAEAHALNQRRLSDEEIPTQELDAIIDHRKKERRKKENIWTWDDWLAHIRKSNDDNNNNGTSNHDDTDIDIHLVLEAAVPPWELQLHRPTSLDNNATKLLPRAPDYIRCVPRDEESDEEEDDDPSSDGVGSYLDYVYRRFMVDDNARITGQQQQPDKNDASSPKTNWLHCVDTRDLGCQTACHTDAVKQRWSDLLLPDELALLEKGKAESTFQPLELDATGQYVKFLPESRMNVERLELETMQRKGLLTDSDCDDDSEDDEDEEFTFPSFEGFFGQATDSLYYSPHVKLIYSPFLAKCVGSLSNWERFFTQLFLGGTIHDALSILNLNENNMEALYVRSPILKSWNPAVNAHDYRTRHDGEHYITYPFFPHLFYLVAATNGSLAPQRTWSSQLLAKLLEDDDKGNESCKNVAVAARNWILESIRRHSEDPKGSDDPHCGGEWFEAFLRATQFDIWKDIDRSDASVLLRKKFMKSESAYGKKYDIGEITIPSTQQGFAEITDRFAKESELPQNEQLVTPRIECMAKILIDIYMSNLVDFGTVLKVAEIVATSENECAVVVCYLGSAHARAVADFYVNHMNFRKKGFVGKLDWDENEPRTIKLPSYLWNINDLFN